MKDRDRPFDPHALCGLILFFEFIDVDAARKLMLKPYLRENHAIQNDESCSP
jgi:hypothetical protein